MSEKLVVLAKAPATCGEYIQGIIDDVPCLVSSPIELYSKTKIKAGEGKNNLKEKSKRGLEILIEKKDLDPRLLESVDIKTESEVPVGIGMASSTSDIVSALAAFSSYFNIPLSEDEIAKICIEVEPSDNLMYRQLNLFNHYSGDVLERFKTSITAPVTVIEFSDVVDTIDFGYETEFKKDTEAFKGVYELFKEGLLERDLSKIAEATTKSALLNQTALYRPELETIIETAKEAGALGILIGHSGSVIGVIEGEDFKRESFKKSFSKEIPYERYKKIYESRLIPGGIELEKTFE